MKFKPMNLILEGSKTSIACYPSYQLNRLDSYSYKLKRP